ncbi:SBBP repeat-containing protein [uncultured Pontibacter sp.]|uniref:SBBP repeat-containing protein n=1 Tax=uncultured Pontibacter sp. TaxID=453356 RepID=UPI0026142C02|nr:SBBP repeat-containing protein [uncultured Pontibacter sp.]
MKLLLPICTRLFLPIPFLLYLCFIFIPLGLSGQNVQEAWAQRYNASLASAVAKPHIAVDESGNTFIISVNQSDAARPQITAFKYGTEARLLWSGSYTASVGSIVPQLGVRGVVVDAMGDLFVIGYEQGSDSRNQSLIIKFSSSDGRVVWANSFRLGMFSEARAVALSQQGGIYVLSTTDGGPERTLANITTTKHSSDDGEVLWADTYDGGVMGSDTPVAMELDNQGGLYVVGSSAGNNTREDIVAIKYDQNTGKREWLERLDIDAQTQRAVGITADNAGAVYVTGVQETASGTAADKLIVAKYSAANGQRLWLTVSENGSAASLNITSNAEGVYTMQSGAGTVASNLVKYNAADGSIAWSSVFDGSPSQLMQDSSGHVLVIGRGTAVGAALVTKYDQTDGTVLWQQTGTNQTDVAMDATLQPNQNTLFVGLLTGEADSATGAVLLSYDVASGNNLISTQISFNQSEDTPVSLAVDAAGNSYVAGTSMNGASGKRIVVLKYSSSGELLWEAVHEDAGSVANDMVIDSSGSVYVTGTNDARGILYTIRYNQSDGAKAWEKTYDNGFGVNVGKAIAVDRSGNVYVTGVANGRITQGMVVLKYNGNTGEELWQTLFIQPIEVGNATFLNYSGNAIALDEAGDLYIAGELRERQSDFLIAKVSGADGRVTWSTTYGSRSVTFERATAIAVDASGGIYVTGASEGRFAVVKYNVAAGELLWEASGESQLPGSGTGSNALALDNNGGLYVTGNRTHSSGSVEMLTVKYDTENGDEVWQTSLDNARGVAIATDSLGGVYVAGQGPVLVKYAADDGNLVWEQRPTAVSGEFIAFSLSGNQNIYALGPVYSSGLSDSDFLIVKYSQQQEPDSCHVPVQVKLYLPPVAKRVGWQVRTTADFGKYTLTEDTGVRWTWGDGSEPSISYTAYSTPRITGEHTYQEAGIYKIGLTFTESCLSPSNTAYEQWIPIFDPEAGTVTGEGSMQLESGTLSFNFNVAYGHKYNTAPQLWRSHFTIEGVGEFESGSVQWLVVTGDRAAWEGEGTLNGTGYYGFITSVTDAGGDGPDDKGDRLRLKIWNKGENNRLVYDSFAEAGEIMNLTNQAPTITNGNIVIQGSGNSTTALESIMQLKAYPNTFAECTAIAFRLGQGQNYRIDVYDTKGNLVRHLAEGSAVAGRGYEYELNGSGLNDGLYIARLVTTNSAKSIKLLLKRN